MLLSRERVRASEDFRFTFKSMSGEVSDLFCFVLSSGDLALSEAAPRRLLDSREIPDDRVLHFCLLSSDRECLFEAESTSLTNDTTGALFVGFGGVLFLPPPLLPLALDEDLEVAALKSRGLRLFDLVDGALEEADVSCEHGRITWSVSARQSIGTDLASGGEMFGFKGDGGFRGEAWRGDETKGSGRRKVGVEGFRFLGILYCH